MPRRLLRLFRMPRWLAQLIIERRRRAQARLPRVRTIIKQRGQHP